MLRMVTAAALMAIAFTLVALTLIPTTAAADSSIPAADTTITVNDTGAIHVTVLQTIPDDPDGTTDYYFYLTKQYRPENVFFNTLTGTPLKFDVTETSDQYSYHVYFDRPYYNGYTFVVQYDCHQRIIYQGGGIYCLDWRAYMDPRMYDRTYTVILPATNVTYVGYNKALDHPESVTTDDGRTVVTFHNVSAVGSDYAWEVQFRATGIDGEVLKVDAPNFKNPMPGMTAVATIVAAITALVIFAMGRKN